MNDVLNKKLHNENLKMFDQVREETFVAFDIALNIALLEGLQYRHLEN